MEEEYRTSRCSRTRTLRWKDKAALVSIEDAPGGHSSMLVPPYVDVLAESTQTYIGAVMARPRLSASNAGDLQDRTRVAER